MIGTSATRSNMDFEENVETHCKIVTDILPARTLSGCDMKKDAVFGILKEGYWRTKSVCEASEFVAACYGFRLKRTWYHFDMWLV